jgi:TonB family protein
MQVALEPLGVPPPPLPRTRTASKQRSERPTVRKERQKARSITPRRIAFKSPMPSRSEAPGPLPAPTRIALSVTSGGSSPVRLQRASAAPPSALPTDPIMTPGSDRDLELPGGGGAASAPFAFQAPGSLRGRGSGLGLSDQGDGLNSGVSGGGVERSDAGGGSTGVANGSGEAGKREGPNAHPPASDPDSRRSDPEATPKVGSKPPTSDPKPGIEPSNSEGKLLRPARYRSTPVPSYPDECRRLKQEGTVHLRVVVNDSGKVDGAELVRSSGFPLLDVAAIKGVRRWTFDPARRGSTSITSTVTVPVRFRLEDG